MATLSTTGSTTREYRDVSLTFARNPVTNDVVATVGSAAVTRSIRMLLSTQTGEVPFFPEFGSRIHQLLFEPSDPITSALLRSEILATINAYEPRAQVQTLTITDIPDQNKYQIDLVLTVINQLQPVTLTLYFTRLR